MIPMNSLSVMVSRRGNCDRTGFPRLLLIRREVLVRAAAPWQISGLTYRSFQLPQESFPVDSIAFFTLSNIFSFFSQRQELGLRQRFPVAPSTGT